MRTRMDRRQFFKASSLGLGTVGIIGYGIAPGQLLASTSPVRRSRYLINLQGFGGWDSSWHHSPVLVKDTAGLSAADLTNQFYGVVANATRFPDSQAIAFANGFVGPTFANYSSADLNNLLIWRGLVAEGSHSVGNHLIQNGHPSSYASSFSTIVADALARAPDYPRTLHYAQLTANTAAFDSGPGLMHGPGIPLNIPNTSSWAALSAADPNDPVADPKLKALVDSTVNNLAGNVSGAQLNATRNLFQGDFLTGYTDASLLTGHNYATSSAFTATVATYHKAVVDDLSALLFSSASASALRDAIALMPGLPAAAANVEAFLVQTIGNLDSLVFAYALADFLITNDLSAVVDLPMSYGDYHDRNDADLIGVAVSLACLKTLLRKLQATPLPNGQSGSFFDATLVVVSTEFDRQVARTVNNPAFSNRPGTNHGSTSSVIMAGYGVNNGKIIGGRGTGPNGIYGGTGMPFLQPLPVDPATGEPNASGVLASQRAVLPTVLKIFGLSVPSQQQTEQVPLPAVIKPGHSGT